MSRCTSINNTKYGVRVENPASVRVRIEDCTIGVIGDANPAYSVWMRSTRSSIVGCNIEHTNTASGSAIRVVADIGLDGYNAIADNVVVAATNYGIALQASTKSTVTGNTVYMTAGNPVTGILLGGNNGSNRCTVVSNTVDNVAGSQAAIRASGEYCSVTGNTMHAGNVGVGILVDGNNNVVVSNASGAATPVSDTGIGNEVAHNI